MSNSYKLVILHPTGFNESHLKTNTENFTLLLNSRTPKKTTLGGTLIKSSKIEALLKLKLYNHIENILESG